MINELQIVNSSVEILSSNLKGSHLAAEVTNSNVVITASSISGKTGILVGSSQLDIAGSHFNVTGEAITVDSESEVILSLVYKNSASPPESPLHSAYILQSGESLVEKNG